MMPKALELCADLRALGSAVLSALEKKDAEQLALLRNSREIAFLKLTEDVRMRQIDEANIRTFARPIDLATIPSGVTHQTLPKFRRMSGPR
jgi:hypothetical protein